MKTSLRLLSLLLFLVPVMFFTEGCGSKPTVRSPIAGQTDWATEIPVGELSDNVRVLQPVVLSKELVSGDWSIGVFMATYSRGNEGVVEIALEQDTRRHIFLDSASLADNAFAYLDVPAEDFHEGPATIVVRGIGGVPGSSPTAWTYTPTAGEKTFTLNGQPRDKALCFRLFSFEEVN